MAIAAITLRNMKTALGVHAELRPLADIFWMLLLARHRRSRDFHGAPRLSAAQEPRQLETPPDGVFASANVHFGSKPAGSAHLSSSAPERSAAFVDGGNTEDPLHAVPAVSGLRGLPPSVCVAGFLFSYEHGFRVMRPGASQLSLRHCGRCLPTAGIVALQSSWWLRSGETP
jgi:hypothetical protein